MSTTAFQALCSGRIRRLVENEAIRRLRTGVPVDATGSGLRDLLIDSSYTDLFKRSRLDGTVNGTVAAGSTPKSTYATYNGFDVYRINGSYYGVPEDIVVDLGATAWRSEERVIVGRSFTEIQTEVDFW